jgi:hypothetical protein
VGAGVLGPVFRAHDPDRDRVVAVKVFRLDITPEQAAELSTELQRLVQRALTHPSIVTPLAAGVEGGVAYLAEEYIPAESLDVAVRQYGPAPVPHALRVITQLAGALDFAGAVEVRHGALHPRDILVSPEETRITGLGVAQALECVRVRVPIRRPYTAPERAEGGPFTIQADLYSLAAIAFELLVGQRLKSTRVRVPPRLQASDRAVVDAVFERALHLAPDDRFSSALGFVVALQAALGGAAGGEEPGVSDAERRPVDVPLSFDPADEPPSPVIARVRGARARPRRPSMPGPPAEGDGDDRGSIDAPEEVRETADEIPSRDEDLRRALIAEEPGHPVTTLPVPPETVDEGRVAPGDEEVRAATDVGELDLDRGAPGEEPAGDRWDSAVPEGNVPDVGVPAAGDGAPPGRPPIEPVPFDQAGSTDTGVGLAPFSNYHRDNDDRGELEGERTLPPDIAPRRPVWRQVTSPLLALVLLLGLLIGFVAGYVIGSRPIPVQEAATGPLPAPPASGAAAPSAIESRPTPPPPGPGASASVPPREAPPTARRPAPATPRAGTPAAPRAVATTGQLVVQSRPAGATLTVNGEARGVTPRTLSNVPLGRHTVRVTRSGYAPLQQQVSLTRSAPRRTVSFSLRPEPRARAQAGFRGQLSVDSRPAGARVFLDGKLVGKTPLALPDVGIGSHVVRLDMTGYRPWSSSVQVAAGSTARVTGSLEREQLP